MTSLVVFFSSVSQSIPLGRKGGECRESFGICWVLRLLSLAEIVAIEDLAVRVVPDDPLLFFGFNFSSGINCILVADAAMYPSGFFSLEERFLWKRWQ